MKKYFIITVDTEGDNLWEYKKGQEVKTENALFIPRFQELCEKYGFKPVWLTNYEMVRDKRYVDYIKPKIKQDLCEVGIHIHAWNNPPLYDLNGTYSSNPYLVEYPLDVMRAKFKITYELITERFEKAPVSHRAGRWVMNEVYFKILEEFGVLVDCSHTPFVSWKETPGETVPSGNDYSKVNKTATYIGEVLEVPMSIRPTHFSMRGSWKHKAKVLLMGEQIWLRPATSSLSEMISLVDMIINEDSSNYLEFMMHSSELMPGGSPYFKDEAEIEKLFIDVEEVFRYVSKKGFKGISLDEYRELTRGEKKS